MNKSDVYYQTLVYSHIKKKHTEYKCYTSTYVDARATTSCLGWMADDDE